MALGLPNVDRHVLFVFWRRQEMIRKTGVGALLSLVFVLFTYSSAVAESYLGEGLGISMQNIINIYKKELGL